MKSKSGCFFFKKMTTDRHVGASSLLEPCEKGCIDIPMQGMSEMFCDYKIQPILQSYSGYLHLLDAVNHGLH